MLRRILIVDPDEVCHELIGRIIDFGVSGPVVHLDHAYNGQGGYRLVCKARDNGQPYDRVFVAAQLPPGWDGMLTVKRIWESGSAEKLVLMGAVHCLTDAESRYCSTLDKPLQEKAVLDLLMNENTGFYQENKTGVISNDKAAINQNPVPLLTIMSMINGELKGNLGNLLSVLGQLSETNLDDHQSNLMRQILDMGFKAQGLCRDAWGLVQIEKRGLPEIGEASSLQQFLEELNAKFAGENTEVTIENHLGSEFPDKIFCDFDRLGQVLMILGRMLARGMKGQIIITQNQIKAEHYLKFTIHDPMEKSEHHDVMRRFQLYERNHVEEAKPRWDLILAGKMVNAMKARFWAEAHQDGGMLYYLTVGFQPEGKTDVEKKRILLVEDNPTNIKIVKLHLKNAGYEVAVSENGRDAVEQALNHHFDLILMDLQMPDIDGFTITRMIREKIKNQVPIIALTANVFGDHRVQSFEAGMVDFIAKPIRRGPFLKRVEKWIGISNASPPRPPSPIPEKEAPVSVDDDPANGNKDRVLDYERLLYEFQDDRDLVKNVVKEFIINTENQLKAILSALMSNDLKTALNQAHSLKGGGSNLCAFSFANAASDLEEACEAKDANGISGALMKLNREFRCLSEIVRQHDHLSL